MIIFVWKTYNTSRNKDLFKLLNYINKNYDSSYIIGVLSIYLFTKKDIKVFLSQYLTTHKHLRSSSCTKIQYLYSIYYIKYINEKWKMYLQDKF
mgnify:CR=1 FL=1